MKSSDDHNGEASSAGSSSRRAPGGGRAKPKPSPISERLHQVLGEATFADIARATGCNSETVRRYMRGGTPSVEFVIGVGRHYGVSLDWLLLGQGTRSRPESVGAVNGDGVFPVEKPESRNGQAQVIIRSPAPGEGVCEGV